MGQDRASIFTSTSRNRKATVTFSRIDYALQGVKATPATSDDCMMQHEKDTVNCQKKKVERENGKECRQQ
ncbi:hypothetical protein E2C01_003463 [Portunus trituberculatus]|uniref:Uncharacterized protein n=1 Tax=Portunus trituberculatus TaxID=210409 RepID=A0A5B7CMV7_PORTR|nr:hypothetical protein [Portunus trituberculatus]